MNNKGIQSIIGLERETTQGLCPPPLLDKVRRDDDGYCIAPLKMRFEFDGKVYEGTAYYVGDVRDKNREQ